MTTQEVDRLSAALAKFNAGDYKEALPLLETLIGENGDPRARYGRAMCLARLDRWEDARDELQGLVRDHPDNATYANELAAIAHRLDDAVSAAMGSATPSQPAGGNTLAALLEGDADDNLGGERLLERHRMLLSHKRLWGGALTLPLLPVVGWLEGELRDISSVNPDLRDALATPLDLVGKLAVVVVLVAVAAVALAVLSSRMTTYVVWDRKIDITTGVLFRRNRTVWLYKLTDIQFRQNPVHMLAGTAALVLYVDEMAPTSKRPPQIVGFAPTRAMQRLQEQLLTMTAMERRDMKKQFI